MQSKHLNKLEVKKTIYSCADIDEVVCEIMMTKLNELLVEDKKHWRSLDTAVRIVA